MKKEIINMANTESVEFRLQHRKLLMRTFGILSLVVSLLLIITITGFTVQIFTEPEPYLFIVFPCISCVMFALLIVSIYFFLYAKNYRIIFQDRKIIVENAFKQIKYFDIENLNTELTEHWVYTTRKTVFRDKSNKKLFATEINTKEFNDYLLEYFTIKLENIYKQNTKIGSKEKLFIAIITSLLAIVLAAIFLPNYLSFESNLTSIEGKLEKWEDKYVYKSGWQADFYLEGDNTNYNVWSVIHTAFNADKFANEVNIGDDIKFICGPFDKKRNRQTIYNIEVNGQTYMRLNDSKNKILLNNLILYIIIAVFASTGIIFFILYLCQKRKQTKAKYVK